MTVYVAEFPVNVPSNQAIGYALNLVEAHQEEVNTLENRLEEIGFSGNDINLFKQYNALEQVVDTASSLGDKLNPEDFVSVFKEQYGALFQGKKDGKTLDERYKNMFTLAKKELQEENYSPKSRITLKNILKIAGMVTLGGMILIPTMACGGKHNGGNGPGPDLNPDLTLHCLNLNGGSVIGAQTIVDGTAYNTTNGVYTIEDLDIGLHSVDYQHDSVWDAWLFVRTSLSGENIEQKDSLDREARINITSDTDVYLIKIPKAWDMDTVALYLEERNGMYKFTGNPPYTVPVIVINEYGDITEAQRVLESNLTQMNNAQIRGNFTSPRVGFEIQTLAPDPRIDVYFKDIFPQQSIHGELVSDYQITNTRIELPGAEENTLFSKTLEELFGGITHTEIPDELYIKLLNGENYNDLANQVMMCWAQFDEGTHFEGGTAVVLHVSDYAPQPVNPSLEPINPNIPPDKFINKNKRQGKKHPRTRKKERK